jgi:hypothetical protein
MSTDVWMFNLVFAKNKDMQFEISDCQVQRTATTEKGGPCPEMGTRTRLDNSFDNSFDNNMVKSQNAMDKNSVPTPIHSNLDSSLEQVDPFGPISK